MIPLNFVRKWKFLWIDLLHHTWDALGEEPINFSKALDTVREPLSKVPF